MPRTHQPYPLEFGRCSVELARVGRSVSEPATKFEPYGETIHNWITQADLDEGLRSDGLSCAEREEPSRLQQERDISTHQQ